MEHNYNNMKRLKGLLFLLKPMGFIYTYIDRQEYIILFLLVLLILHSLYIIFDGSRSKSITIIGKTKVNKGDGLFELIFFSKILLILLSVTLIFSLFTSDKLI